MVEMTNEQLNQIENKDDNFGIVWAWIIEEIEFMSNFTEKVILPSTKIACFWQNVHATVRIQPTPIGWSTVSEIHMLG